MLHENFEDLEQAGVPFSRRFRAFNGDALKIRENALQLNDGVLTYQQWLHIDRNISEPMRERMPVAMDILALGTENLGIWARSSTWERSTEVDDATITTDLRTIVDQDRQAYKSDIAPLFWFGKQFSLTEEELNGPNASENIESGAARETGRAVGRSIEDNVLNGSAIVTADGGTSYGLTNHPDRITSAFAQTWDTAANIYLCIEEIIQSMILKTYEDQLMLYLNRVEFAQMTEKEGVDRVFTVLARVLEAFAPFGLMGIKIADRLAAGNVLCVRLNKEDIDMAVGLPVRPYEWSERPLITNVMVLGKMGQRIKRRIGTTGVDQVAIAHYTTI